MITFLSLSLEFLFIFHHDVRHPHTVSLLRRRRRVEQELESMLTALRTRGYTVFAKAIFATNLFPDILVGTSFTFFAPTNSSLHALDMAATAEDYVATLRCHIVPAASQSSISDLFLPPLRITTLDPNHDVIQVQRQPVSDVIFVDGVDLVVPGLFYGGEVVVHGFI
ncbi:hypothetical protein C3L33_03906, partial [Rhododendron williamsianum]